MVTASRAFEIGTEAWLDQTGGRLTIPQALALSTQGFAQSARDRVSRSRPDQGGSSRQAARMAVARKELAVVLESQRDRVVERQGQALLNHVRSVADGPVALKVQAPNLKAQAFYAREGFIETERGQDPGSDVAWIRLVSQS